MNTTVDNMDKALKEILDEYTESVDLGVKEATKKVAKDTVKELKQTSPSKTGSYKKGWTSKKTYETANKIEVVVHNKTDYQLAHLLEYGHAVVKGGRTIGHAPAYPHIAEAEKHATENLEKEIEIVVRK